MSESSEQAQQGRTLLWCLRHYVWVVLACILVGAATPLLVVPDEQLYQADALVVAGQLAATDKVLPTLSESVFADGAVAAALAADPAGRGRELIPDRVFLVSGPDSITMVVRAQDVDPQTAKTLADVAATAFAAELNRGGAGVGEFTVQGEAVLPDAPLQQTSSALWATLGGLAGLVLGLGLIALLAVLRRPCVTAGDVEAAVGVPLLGTVELRRAARGTYLGPRGVRGIATVTRWLATVPSGRLTLVSTPSAAGIRQRLYVMVAIAMAPARRLQLEAADELVEVVRDHTRSGAGRAEDDADLMLVDGGSPFELVDPAAAPVSVVAVAPIGTTRGRLGALALDYLNGGLVGVILVKRRLGLRRARRARPARSPAGPAPALRPVGDLAKPERV
jgi:hypothetical protein